MHDKWWPRIAKKVQHYADTNNSHKFLSLIKSVFGPLISRSAPLFSADGTALIKDKAGINNRGREHFIQLLN